MMYACSRKLLVQQRRFAVADAIPFDVYIYWVF